MAKDIIFDLKARDAIKKGADALADAVKVTLGPKGRNVIIDKKFGAPIITKDGVTVAKEIELADPVQNMGAQLLKEVASKTADIADDGTNDWQERQNKDGSSYIALNTEHVQRSRLRVDTRKWIASKLKPKKYGDKQAVEHSGNIALDKLVEGSMKVES